MQKRRLLFATLALVFAAGTVCAGATTETIPDHIAGHISIKSPNELVAMLDEYVVNSTAGTPNELPPGLLSMLAAVYLPLPLDAWDADEEAHVILLPDSTPRGAPQYVLVVAVESFNAFVDTLAEREWLVGDPGADERFAALRPVVIPGGRAMVVADLGNGRVALSDTADRIQAALAGGWTPAHSGDADLTFFLTLNSGSESLVEKTAAYISRKTDEIVAAISQNGIKPDVARGLAQVLEKYAPLLVAELEKAELLRVELRVDGDDVAMDVSGLFHDGSLFREVADHSEAAPPLDLDLARRIPRSAASVAVGLASEDLLPNARQRTIALNADIYSMVWPAFKDKLAAITDSYFHNGPDQTAAATFIYEGRQASVSIITADDPEAMLKVFVDSLQELNNIWAASIDNPDLTAHFAGELKNNGSQAYWAYQPWFPKDKGEAFQAFLDGIAAENPDLRSVLQVNLDFRIYLSQLDDGVVFAVGDMRDDEFVALLSGLNRPADDPLLNTVSAQAVLPLLEPGQISVAVLDADALVRIMTEAVARDTDLSTPEGQNNPYRVAAKTMRYQDRGDVLGVALGAEDGWLTMRLVVPADAVNTIIRDYSAFERVWAQERERLAAEENKRRRQEERERENGDNGDGVVGDEDEEADPEEFDEIGAA